MNDNATRLPDKPRPQPSPLTWPYWDALREHRFVVQRCTRCGTLRHYPREVCDRCYSMDYEWQELSGRGTVHSWTVCHHPFHLAFKREVPYVMLTVDLEEGVRAHARLQGAGADAIAIGTPVVIDFEDVDDTLTLPCFRIEE